ncbi:phage scaffolding protein [Clostridium gasigenes]|uniref:phage scaffolding protein n=1 Tax=Clostridium gasigenes TaxID=94869 RepID=UPI001626896D|nr:phage scaffolding protein [Clostridium gasigenes]MBB6622239.1 phage scaffolding protein [Clostridium gasigenes]
MEELLKAQGLTAEQIKVVMAGMVTNKIYTTSLENADERYNKLKGQKEDAEEQLKTANTTMTDLKKNNKDNETLQATIKTHEGTIATLKTDSDAKIKNITIDTAIDKLLATNKAKHSDLLASKFVREKLVVAEDGKIAGLDEQFKGIKETYKDLFEETIKGKTPNNTGGAQVNNTYETLMNNADTMTSEEVAAQFMAMKK